MRGVGRFAVDAGGTRTRVLAIPPGGGERRFELPSVNPSGSGRAADRVLLELVTAVRAALGAGPAVGWLASASVDPDSAHRERDRVRHALRQAGTDMSLVLSNDVVPLLWGVPALAGRGVVVVCGTGSGVFGGDGSGRLVRVGGCEYLGSDEGGAVDLGLRGLRAAVRCLDGRGAATRLVPDLAEHLGSPVPEAARRIATEPFPKQRLAALAPVVCGAWLAGDSVAGEIVRDSIGELVLGVATARARLGLGDGGAAAATGGVVTGCRAFTDALTRRLVEETGLRTVELVADTPAAVLDAVTRFLGPDGRPVLPPGLRDTHAWTLREPGPPAGPAAGSVAGPAAGSVAGRAAVAPESDENPIGEPRRSLR